MTGLGWLGIKIGDIDGTQWVGHVGIEYLAGKRWGFGAGFNLATVDVDWAGIETEVGNLLNGALTWDINDFQRYRTGEVLAPAVRPILNLRCWMRNASRRSCEVAEPRPPDPAPRPTLSRTNG